MPEKTYREVLARASSFLEARHKEGYSIQYLLLERKGWSTTDWLLHMNETMPPEELQQLKADLDMLLQSYPPQYLIGEVEFYGRRFKVTEDTLIPRPETEELVELCLKENPIDKKANATLHAIDIGTGTGVIALSLKAARPDWQVAASDISEAALEVATVNAKRHQLTVDFRKGSVLQAFPGEMYDIIISNPPYISAGEWSLMDESVRSYEPKQALFAADDGLAIYKKIAEESQKHLQPDGKIYLEIGFQQGTAVKVIFQQAFPEKEVEVKQDFSGKDRMVVVHNPGA